MYRYTHKCKYIHVAFHWYQDAIVIYTISVMEIFNREDKQCIRPAIIVYVRHVQISGTFHSNVSYGAVWVRWN